MIRVTNFMKIIIKKALDILIVPNDNIYLMDEMIVSSD